MNKIAVVTGATSGFGKAIALKLASLGYHLILTGRRKELLLEVATTIQSSFEVQVLPLCFDVRDEAQVESAFLEIPEHWRHWSVLINNAGLAAGKEPLHEGDSNDWNQMIDTNVKGLLYVTRTFVRVMIENRRGIVINIGSIAGRDAYAGGNVYSATKFAVEGLTRSMRIDFLPYNIKVGQIAPGAAETEFSLVRFKGDAEKAKSIYKGYTPLNAEDIADAVEFMVTRPEHVNISDILIMPTAQANSTTFNKD